MVGTLLWGNPVPLFGVSTIYRLVLVLGVNSAILTLGALIYTLLAWPRRFWSLAGRIYYTMVTLTAVGLVWFLYFWNLLGWRLQRNAVRRWPIPWAWRAR